MQISITCTGSSREDFLQPRLEIFYCITQIGYYLKPSNPDILFCFFAFTVFCLFVKFQTKDGIIKISQKWWHYNFAELMTLKFKFCSCHYDNYSTIGNWKSNKSQIFLIYYIFMRNIFVWCWENKFERTKFEWTNLVWRLTLFVVWEVNNSHVRFCRTKYGRGRHWFNCPTKSVTLMRLKLYPQLLVI